MRLGANQQPIVDPGTGIRWQPCKNVSGEVIPPHAVVRFACMNDDGALDVDKVNGDLIAHGVTNHDAIPVDGYGFVTATFPNWARVDLDGVDATGSASASASSGASSGSGGPIVDCGAFLGVREGSWSLHLARAGASGGSSGSASGSSGSASGSSSGGGASGDENNAPPAQYQACSPAKNDPPRIYVVALGGSGGSRIRVKIPICVSLQPDIADPSGGSSGSPSGSASATGTGGTRSGGTGIA